MIIGILSRWFRNSIRTAWKEGMKKEAWNYAKRAREMLIGEEMRLSTCPNMTKLSKHTRGKKRYNFKMEFESWREGANMQLRMSVAFFAPTPPGVFIDV